MEKPEYRVTLEVHARDEMSPEAIEDDLERLVAALLEKASSLALGPAGAIHGSTIEVAFTVEATDTAELYAKLHDIAVILRDHANVDFSATSARRDDREFALA